eukprot:tig00021501_g21958.t1
MRSSRPGNDFEVSCEQASAPNDLRPARSDEAFKISPRLTRLERIDRSMLRPPPPKPIEQCSSVEGGIRVRLATIWDLAALSALHAECFFSAPPGSWRSGYVGFFTSLDVIDRFDSTIEHVFVAEDERTGDVLGCVDITERSSWVPPAAHVCGNSLYISCLAVRGDVRRRGVGTRLMRFCEEVGLRDPDIDSLYLHVESSNATAKAVYAKLGYVDDSRRPWWTRLLRIEGLYKRLRYPPGEAPPNLSTS